MQLIFDVKDFQKEVIEKSKQVPVLVDFWATWCHPCRILSPILEELTNKYKGRFILAKTNTEELIDIAAEYNIQSIPNVKLFIDGKVTAEFMGALPRVEIEKFIDQNIPSEDQLLLTELKSNYNNTNPVVLKSKLENIIKRSPQLIEAKILLSRLIAIDKPVDALNLVANVFEDSPFFYEANQIRTINYLLTLKNSDLPGTSEKTKLFSATKFLIDKDFDNSLQIFIDLLIVNKKYLDEIARKACLAIFYILGDDHLITKKYRKRFEMSLY